MRFYVASFSIVLHLSLLWISETRRTNPNRQTERIVRLSLSLSLSLYPSRLSLSLSFSIRRTQSSRTRRSCAKLKWIHFARHFEGTITRTHAHTHARASHVVLLVRPYRKTVAGYMFVRRFVVACSNESPDKTNRSRFDLQIGSHGLDD